MTHWAPDNRRRDFTLPRSVDRRIRRLRTSKAHRSLLRGLLLNVGFPAAATALTSPHSARWYLDRSAVHAAYRRKKRGWK